MFAIDPQALYSKDDLARELDGMMTAETFLERLAPFIPRRFKGAYWGADIIAALPSVLIEDAAETPLPMRPIQGRRRAASANGNPHYIDPKKYHYCPNVKFR